MKTINVSEATGPALNWLVAVAEDLSLNMLDLLYDIKCYSQFNPSTDWSQGGPIIEKMASGDGFRLDERPDSMPLAEAYYDQMRGEFRFHASGSTPLIAAMRCYVISKLGETAEVPEGPL